MNECVNCKKSFDPRGWIAGRDGAVVYFTKEGRVSLCSVACEREFLMAKAQQAKDRATFTPVVE